LISVLYEISSRISFTGLFFAFNEINLLTGIISGLNENKVPDLSLISFKSSSRGLCLIFIDIIVSIFTS